MAPMLLQCLRAMWVLVVQCGEDIPDVLRVANFCLKTHLLPQLGKHATVDLYANDKDLVMGQPYHYIHIEGSSIGLAMLITLVYKGTYR